MYIVILKWTETNYAIKNNKITMIKNKDRTFVDIQMVKMHFQVFGWYNLSNS